MRLAALVAVAAVLGVAAPARATDGARITDEKKVGERVLELTIATSAFTAPTKVHVDLPVGYDADPGRRWPVTYYVAGTNHRYGDFNNQYDGEKLSRSLASIVVSPNGNSGYWSDWYNGGAFGPPMYETYVVDQLIGLIDGRLRTTADRAGRAILGESMGGFGAAMLAARHPDLFAAAASLSGAVDSNLPANGAVLSASSSIDGAPPDAIFGPRATQEVRWRGHNPTDLAGNLRDVDVQVRSANGTPDPALGESAGDMPACVVEQGVYMASVDLHQQLDALHIPHVWKDYGPGCHTVPNFERQIADSFAEFTRVFAHPQPPPASFEYESIEPHFDVWGWHVDADPARALEFLVMQDAGPSGVKLTGSGTTTVTTPPLFRGLRRVDVAGGVPAAATPDAHGRIRFTVDLGAADSGQQYAPGTTTTTTTRGVKFAPYAIVRITRVRAAGRRVRVCARALGGRVHARISLVGARARAARATLGSRSSCRTLWRPAPGRARGTVRITGHDAAGHAVSTRRAVVLH